MEVWPVCPHCQKPRMTVCPFCHTSGSSFPAADALSQDPADDQEPAGQCGQGCGCGHAEHAEHGGRGNQGDCCGGQGDCCGGQGDDSEAADETFDGPLLLCPTCDEPFAPRYLRRCEWCGHEFAEDADALEAPVPQEFLRSDEPRETINTRILLALGVLLVLVVGIIAYVALILGRLDERQPPAATGKAVFIKIDSAPDV